MKGMQGITAKPDTALGINKKLEGLALAFSLSSPSSLWIAFKRSFR